MTDVELDVVTQAREGFDTAQQMRTQADRKVAGLRGRELSLASHLDDLQQQYEAKAKELQEIQRDIAMSQKVGDSMSDAMDAYDEVLRLNGIEREVTS